MAGLGGVDNVTSRMLKDDASTIWHRLVILHPFLWRMSALLLNVISVSQLPKSHLNKINITYWTKWSMSPESVRTVKASLLVQNRKMIASTGQFGSVDVDNLVEYKTIVLWSMHYNIFHIIVALLTRHIDNQIRGVAVHHGLLPLIIDH